MVDELDPQAGDAVLDIGCGTGALIPALVEAVGPQGRVVAMDFSARMVAITRKRAVWPNVEVRQADACVTDHSAGQFDAADALKPDGRLFVFDVRLVKKHAHHEIHAHGLPVDRRGSPAPTWSPN